MRVPDARSLKDKRAVVRSVKDRLRRLNVSVAETDHQTLRQRCRLTVTAVGVAQQAVARSLDAVVEEIERQDPGLIVSADREWLA